MKPPGPKPKGEKRVRRINKDSTAIVCPLCGATTQVTAITPRRKR